MRGVVFPKLDAPAAARRGPLAFNQSGSNTVQTDPPSARVYFDANSPINARGAGADTPPPKWSTTHGPPALHPLPEVTTVAYPGNAATTSARGYGTAHQAERKRWEPVVAAGDAICTRCQEPIDPNEPFDLDHNEDRTGYLGVAHVACNRRAGGKNGAETTNGKRQMIVREW